MNDQSSDRTDVTRTSPGLQPVEPGSHPGSGRAGADSRFQPRTDDGSGPGSLAQAVEQIETAMVSPVREQVRRRVLQFCRDRSDALYRTCRSGHLTGSGFVVDPKARKVLLIHHRKLDRWLQPGGHADGDGLLSRVAQREVQEETGLTNVVLLEPAFDIDVHTIPARGDEPEHVHLDLRFLAIASSRAPIDPNAETKGAQWLDANHELLAGTDEVAESSRRALALADDHRLDQFLP